jgi:serine/threonine protein kinase
MANLLETFSANIPRYLQEFPLTREEKQEIQKKQTQEESPQIEFPPIEQIQAKLAKVVQEFLENPQNIFLHLHSSESPFCLRAMDMLREKATQGAPQEETITLYVVSKKAQRNIGSYKIVRLAVNLSTLETSARIQNKDSAFVSVIQTEFSHLQKLQEFSGFCKILHSETYPYLKFSREKDPLGVFRRVLFVEWLAFDLFDSLSFRSTNFQFSNSRQIYFIMQELLSQLLNLHERGIVLRDIKLENLMLKKEGKQENKTFSRYRPIFIDTDSVSFAKPKRFKGTLGYIPPEVLFQFIQDSRGKVLADPSWICGLWDGCFFIFFDL